MNYRDRVYNYFNFSSALYTYIGGKNKKVIQITGKLSFRMIMIWLIISLFMTILLCAISSKYFGDTFNYQALTICLVIAVLAVIIVLVKSKLTFKKLEPKKTNTNLYERELPSKLRPAHMRILINDGLVDELSLASTILDLIDRGYLDIKRGTNSGEKSALFRDRQITLVKTAKPDQDLLKYERFIIDWFINQYGNGSEVSQEQVNQGLLNNVGNYDSRPYELFEEWQALVIMSFPIDKHFKRTNQNKARIIYALFALLGFIPVIPFLGSFLGIYGLGCLLFASPMYVLNKTGIEEGSEWLNLKRFLKDFGDMKDKTTEMVKIWDFYLTYSIALNVSSVATNEIEGFFGNNIYRGTVNDNDTSADINGLNNNGNDAVDLSSLIKKAKAGIEASNKQLELEIAEEMRKL